MDFEDMIKATNQLTLSESKDILSRWTWSNYTSPLNRSMEVRDNRGQKFKGWESFNTPLLALKVERTMRQEAESWQSAREQGPQSYNHSGLNSAITTWTWNRILKSRRECSPPDILTWALWDPDQRIPPRCPQTSDLQNYERINV